MKFYAWMLMGALSIGAYAQDVDPALKKAGEHFSQGRFDATLVELKEVETREKDPKKLGLIYYWKGVCQSRSQDFPDAIGSFQKAMQYDHPAQDLAYEYGQALFAAEKLSEARMQFARSFKNGFKRGVSLYYMGFISRELGERKKAFTYFRGIQSLATDEINEVGQAAEMQIGDVYLEQIEKHPDSFRGVESIVIPQYERALELQPESALAPKIKEKIADLQRKYELVLFQLRNGRPTLRPPYFLRLAAEVSHDSNVTFTPNQTTVAKAKQGSLFGRTSAMGRYTFYHHDYFSVAPEMNFSYTRYFNRIPEIYRNDNYFVAPSLRTAYEHTVNGKPASFLLDYEYNEVKRDVRAKEQLEFNSRSHAVVIGERFSFFNRGETVARLRHRMTDSYLDTADAKTTSFILEQVVGMTTNTLMLYFSYDRTRMTGEVFDTDSILARGDLIMSKVKDWFTPSVGLALTTIDPINDRTNRGRELLLNPNARLSRVFGKNWRGNLKFDYQKYNSKDEASFAYKKYIYGFELEYLF